MARTLAETDARTEPSTPRTAPASRNGAALAAHPRTAYKLIDGRGRCAYLWWEEGPVVESHDRAFRQRILRAVRKPIWSREDELDEFGVPWSTRVLLQPDDPRYSSRLFFRWDQVGLGDLAGVEVVTRHDRRPVESRLSPRV
jgi:hypothetical protein